MTTGIGYQLFTLVNLACFFMGAESIAACDGKRRPSEPSSISFRANSGGSAGPVAGPTQQNAPKACLANGMDGANGFKESDSQQVKTHFRFGYSHGPGGATGKGGCRGGNAPKEVEEVVEIANKYCKTISTDWTSESILSDKGLECFVEQMLPGGPLAGFTDIEIDNAECFTSTGKNKFEWLQKISKLMDQKNIPCGVAIVAKNFSMDDYKKLAAAMEPGAKPSGLSLNRVSNFAALETTALDGHSKEAYQQALKKAKITVALSQDTENYTLLEGSKFGCGKPIKSHADAISALSGPGAATVGGFFAGRR